jgi:hypothetical protein
VSTPAMNQPPDLWEKDGSYRDVYIQGTSMTDWEVLFAVGKDYGHRYWRDGVEQAVPQVARVFEDREHSHLLSLYADSVRLNIHFFTPDEIELDIDPREILGPNEHYAVLQLLERLSTATNKKLSVTAENSEDLVFLTYEPATKTWSTHAPYVSDA